MIYSISAAGVLSLLASVSADVYMHNPRGSNDRNCERNVNRNNGNRVFDSQNNAKGGYACPRAVGGPEMQNEMGEAKFYDIDSATGAYVCYVLAVSSPVVLLLVFRDLLPPLFLSSSSSLSTSLPLLLIGQTVEFTQDKRVYYYEGSILPIEWTNQHGCGSNSKTSCEIVLQYACEDTLDPKVDNVSDAKWNYYSTFLLLFFSCCPSGEPVSCVYLCLACDHFKPWIPPLLA